MPPIRRSACLSVPLVERPPPGSTRLGLGVPDPDCRSCGVHVRGNDYFRFTPYVTAGVGAFTADTVGRQELVDAGVSEWTRRTDLATNVGAGVTYRLSEHLGLNADWRTFFVNGDNDVERVNRFTTGFSVSLR
jgi:opacity protein-like surface antigen